jgi:hypothetical protein
MPNALGWAGSTTKWLATLAVAACASLVATIAVLQGAPYDDEVSNFRLVEGRDIASIIQTANSTDVHPAGSYVLNAILHNLLGSWESVKIAGGCLNAFALALFLFFAYDRLSKWQQLLLTGLLATASTVILWGASVRWYAYFNPAFTAALALLLFAELSRTARSIVLAVSAILLFHLSYAAVCAVFVLLLVHAGRDYREWKRTDLLTLMLAGGVAIAVCIPQMLIFLHVHLPNQGHQTGGPITALIQTGTTVILGNAVFPAAPLPILYAVIISAACLFWLAARRKAPLQWLVVAALVAGIIVMAVLGIGIKPRNSVFLLPLVALVFCWAITALPAWAATIAALVVFTFQGIGVWNVLFHVDTLKGSYNSDFRGAMQQIQLLKSSCGRIVVFNHDPVLSYLLDRDGIAQSSPYEATTRPRITVSLGECVVLAKTFHGAIAPPTVAQMYSVVQSDALQPLESRDIGPDRYFAIKGKLMHDAFPPFYIGIELFKANRDATFTDWSALATPEGEAR